MFSMGETMQPMRRTVAETAVPEAAGVEDQLAAFFEAHHERMVRLAGLVCGSGVPRPERSYSYGAAANWNVSMTLRAVDGKSA
jgi:hypothetical protein